MSSAHLYFATAYFTEPAIKIVSPVTGTRDFSASICWVVAA